MAHQSSVQRASVTSMGPALTEQVDTKDKGDLTPSDSQPPGVDDEPQSLEEALVGWIGREAPQSRTSLSLAFALQGGYH